MSIIIGIILMYIVINAWILAWFWRMLRGANAIRIIACALLLILMAAYPACFRKSADSALEIELYRIGAFWIGSFLYLFTLTIIVTVIAGIRRLRKNAPWRLLTRATICIAVITATIAIAAIGYHSARYADPAIYEIELTDRPLQGKTFTIFAVADLHMGRSQDARQLGLVTKYAEAFMPDAMLYLGDVIDDHVRIDTALVAYANNIRINAPLGTWGILGNHEYIAGDINYSIKAIETMGISVLRDSYAEIGDFLLVGRDDFSRARFRDVGRPKLADILSDLPDSVRQLPMIVMDHQPRDFDEVEKSGALLQLSGHTHNGQLWPFNYIMPLIYENHHGHSQRGNTHYIVTSGLGTWGPPIRTNSRSEFLIIRIKY